MFYLVSGRLSVVFETGLEKPRECRRGYECKSGIPKICPQNTYNNEKNSLCKKCPTNYHAFEEGSFQCDTVITNFENDLAYKRISNAEEKSVINYTQIEKMGKEIYKAERKMMGSLMRRLSRGSNLFIFFYFIQFCQNFQFLSYFINYH